MKIIFNHAINDWYWQIYDELKRKHELIIPDNYKTTNNQNSLTNLESLERSVKENNDCDFIFDFRGDLYHLIKWKQKKIDIPIVIFQTNAISRPYLGKLTAYAKVWYVEYHAKSLMERFNKENLIYEGMAANPYIFRPLEIEKVYDISFIGQHYGERGYWLNLIKNFSKKKKLKNNFPIAHGVKMYLSFNEINEKYYQSKINLSFAPKEPPGKIVNLRTFEICMSGNFQLMQYTPCVEEYFEIDKEIVCWKDRKDLFEKILYYLENEDERKKIAKNGYKRATKHHTWSIRFEKIQSILKKKDPFNLKKIIVKAEEILKRKDILKIQELYYTDTEYIELILKKLGFKKKDLKKKKKLKIREKERIFYYKPDLNDFYFIELYGKVMMVIKIIPSDSDFNLNEWSNLTEILYLTESLDYNSPQFGIITNGNEWIIKDFKYNKWLREIPSRKVIKSRLDFKNYFILRMLYYLDEYYTLYNLTKIIPKDWIRRLIKPLYKKLVRFF